MRISDWSSDVCSSDLISAGAQEEIDGITYIVTRPRNVGRAKLQGIEVSGQNFFDFLPGALNGIGVMGSFTYAASEVQGDDSLAGEPLQGGSTFNYTDRKSTRLNSRH